MNDIRKNPFNWLAALFGFYWFPYKGLWREFRRYYIYLGFFNLIFAFLSKRFPAMEIVLTSFIMLVDLAAIIHIGLNATRYAQEYGQAKSLESATKNSAAATIATALFVLTFSGLIYVVRDYVSLIKYQKESVTRTLAFTYKITSNQMYPTYSIGDGLFIDSTVPEIYAGDIIAYRINPSDSLQIARVIAITGDILVRKNGLIKVNDRVIENKVVNKAEFIDTLPEEYQEEKYLIKQEMNDNISYYTITSGRVFGDLNFKIPDNKIFVIIDNRDLENSTGQLVDLASVIGVNTQ